MTMDAKGTCLLNIYLGETTIEKRCYTEILLAMLTKENIKA